MVGMPNRIFCQLNNLVVATVAVHCSEQDGGQPARFGKRESQQTINTRDEIDDNDENGLSSFCGEHTDNIPFFVNFVTRIRS